MMTTQL